MDSYIDEDPIPVDQLEHVVATVDIIHPHRKYLDIFLESPSGTLSQQLTQRPMDDRRKGIRMWSFMSVHFWDEHPVGQWKLIIVDHSPCKGIIGKIDYFALTFYGTSHGHHSFPWTMRDTKRAYIPTYKTLKQVVEKEKDESKSIRII